MWKFLLGILWLAASVYLGYRLTAHSFSQIPVPDIVGEEKTPFTKMLDLVPGGLLEKLPDPSEDPAEWYAAQSPATQDCLRKAVGEEDYQAALAGEEVKPSPLQMLAIGVCLK